MSTPEVQHAELTTGGPRIQRMCAACKATQRAQTTMAPDQASTLAEPVSAGGSTVLPALGSGRPLPPSERRFFNARFGFDFSRVRIHADERADAAARQLSAQAFTLHHDVVFRKGAYRPGTDSGRHLLAHELTHVVQQTSSLASSPASPETPARRIQRRLARTSTPVIQRQVAKPTKAEARIGRLEDMAKWPSEAHIEWKQLDATDRTLVLWQMAANYGADFAKEFLKDAGKKKLADIYGYYFGPGVGPKPSTLRARKYELAQKDSVHEWWVHPSGITVTRNYTQDQPTATEAKASKPEPEASPPSTRSAPPPEKEQAPAPLSERCKTVATLGANICDNAERICNIAAEMPDDEWARNKCEEARNKCTEASQRSQSCTD